MIARKSVPTHVAIVMDGNGRWAKKRGLSRTEGHVAGERALYRTVEAAQDLGIGHLTVFAFSTENWKRPVSEVKFLMNFNEELIVARRDELHARGIKVQFMGRRNRKVPAKVLRRFEETEALTKDNDAMTLTIAFNYGGRAEIVDAVKRISTDVAAGVRKSDKIDEETIAGYMYQPELPDPDLIIRTSGEQRVSNFLIWEGAYSEYYFTDALWPDFDRRQLESALEDYSTRVRRFGGAT